MIVETITMLNIVYADNLSNIVWFLKIYAINEVSIAINVTNITFKKPINSFVSSIFAISHYTIKK